jgi:hypothetical protein
MVLMAGLLVKGAARMHRPRTEHLVRQRFLDLRQRGDGRALANATGANPFCRRLLHHARDRLLWDFAPWKRDEIEAIALATLCQHLEKTCGRGFRELEESFGRFFFRACWRHLRWGRGRWLRDQRAVERNLSRALVSAPNQDSKEQVCHDDPASDSRRLPAMFSYHDDRDLPADDRPAEGFFARGASRIAAKLAAWPDTGNPLRAVMLHLLEGASIEETARALGCSEKTVQNYRGQGLRRLREELDGELRL